MSINHYPFAQATFLENAGLGGRGGVCLELSRRWVKMRMPGDLGCEELQQVVTLPGTAQEVFTAQKAEPWSRQVSGLGIEKTKTRQGIPGIWAVRGLTNREAVINYVLSHPGLYIYGATGQVGHAFAFDSRSARQLLLFDANQGSWEFFDEPQHAIVAWWRDFWEGTAAGTRVNYKTLLHKGIRELTRYQMAA